MKYKDVWNCVKDNSFIHEDRGLILYKMILRDSPDKCLNLGTAHGASACIIAAALDEKGKGEVDTVDLETVEWKPNVNELSSKSGLSKYIKVFNERSSYTWFLKKKIEENTKDNICKPEYDFVFLDGSKNWNYDGFAFFLIDKLLKPNGTIIFDDMFWTYKMKDGIRNETDGISHRSMGTDELCEPHIHLIFKLLVMQHPSYHKCTIIDNWWGICKKKV